MSKTLKVTIKQSERKVEYPKLPFVIKSGGGFYLVGFHDDITLTDLTTGNVHKTAYRFLSDYFKKYPNDTIVESEIFIRGEQD